MATLYHYIPSCIDEKCFFGLEEVEIAFENSMCKCNGFSGYLEYVYTHNPNYVDATFIFNTLSRMEKHVDEKSSPCYIMHTSNDAVVPVGNALCLAKAYADEGKEFELHIYPDSPHGVALGNEITRCNEPKWEDESIAKWIENAVYWTKKIR